MNVKYWNIFDIKANAFNILPGDYNRKIETQRNWRGPITNGGACGLIR